MTFVGNSYLGIGHIFVTFICGTLIYILVEFQVRKLCEIYIVQPFLSHDHIIKKSYDQELSNQETKFKEIDEDELIKKRIEAKL